MTTTKPISGLTGAQLQTAMLTLRLADHDDAANIFQAELTRRAEGKPGPVPEPNESGGIPAEAYWQRCPACGHPYQVARVPDLDADGHAFVSLYCGTGSGISSAYYWRWRGTVGQAGYTLLSALLRQYATAGGANEAAWFADQLVLFQRGGETTENLQEELTDGGVTDEDVQRILRVIRRAEATGLFWRVDR